ncbi:unnamed protein product [Gadus morhua 'NCC']
MEITWSLLTSCAAVSYRRKIKTDLVKLAGQPSTSSISLVFTSPQPRPHQSNKSPRKSLSGSYLAFPVIRERLSLSPDDCETEMLQMDTHFLRD